MPPWLAAGMLMATFTVVYALCSYWRDEPKRGHRHAYQHSSEPSMRNRERMERYDTPPECRWRGPTDENCSICLEPLSSLPQHTLQCEHRLHFKCFKELLSQSDSCPICRRPL